MQAWSSFLHLPKIACSARLYQGRLSCQAQPIDVAAGFQVVQAVHDQVKRLEEVHIILLLLHIALQSHIAVTHCISSLVCRVCEWCASWTANPDVGASCMDFPQIAAESGACSDACCIALSSACEQVQRNVCAKIYCATSSLTTVPDLQNTDSVQASRTCDMPKMRNNGHAAVKLWVKCSANASKLQLCGLDCLKTGVMYAPDLPESWHLA